MVLGIFTSDLKSLSINNEEQDEIFEAQNTEVDFLTTRA
jgi:hypothetical protein